MPELVDQLQLNKYETAPNFIQLSQNLTSDCLQNKAKQFYDHMMQKRVKTGKNTEINKQSDVKFWLN